jgi:hypothetical protein
MFQARRGRRVSRRAHGHVFELANEFIEMLPDEIEKSFESFVQEVRAGGLSIMDKQARPKKTPENRRKELFDL